ncbi:hypothetical protein [Chitinophaga sp. Cy-1792]|uniref:hypothetical protein n=1 Tax=Chitinophaga sp. Cy-1792 TaxID=2608339 RepID=UPI0014215FE8|nr:hypothetical protein [Chitinophaga sp. Cy-1792]NIG55829.1 hypothetical protein [Chitinophaga sp. Cy-1792]
MNAIVKYLLSFFYKENSNEIYWEKVKFVIITVAIFLVFVFFNLNRLSRLKKDRNGYAHYTIGYTTGRYKNIRSPNPGVSYVYYVNGLKYSRYQSYPMDMDIVTEDGKYFVLFSEKDPSNAEILLRFKVPINTGKPPAAGWSALPNSTE